MIARLVFETGEDLLIERECSFEEFANQVFKREIHLAINSREPSLAINTHKIMYIWEEKK